jgi:hypothetical protein
MTASQKADLLMAILAMDAYNQGYDPGLDHQAKQIGSAKFETDSSIKLDELETKATGFYAAAYTLDAGTKNETTVISYRGTDGDTITDVEYGWTVSLGKIDDNQASQALEFYNKVEEEKRGRFPWKRKGDASLCLTPSIGWLRKKWTLPFV